MELLRYMPGVTLVSVSRYRDTRPIGGPSGQGVFLNGACLLETDLAPHDVLAMLSAVENTLHRERVERWGPRTVDLDLLLYDDVVLTTESLTLPHPRMATRRFVLEPCVEISPDLVHPLAACTLERLLESISSPYPHVAVIGVPGAAAPEVAAAIAHATLARLVPAPPEYTRADLLLSRQEAAGGEGPWHQAVEACAKPLLAKRWPRDPHGTVVDYWLQTVRLAAEESLVGEALGNFQSFFRRLAADTVPPEVAILLIAPPDVLEERVSRRARQADDTGDFGSFSVDSSSSGSSSSGRPSTEAVAGPSAAVCVSVDESVGRLLRLQDRIIAALRCPDAGRPRAVVTIAAGDLGQAVQEAVAAVEAMA
jgi:2-amino-4-hydroxy-6-hydroxymethyldihydropteridine diphosphokinase